MFLCSLPRLSSASISAHLDMEHLAPSCLLLSSLSTWLQVIMSQAYFTSSFSTPEKWEARIVWFTSMLSYNLVSDYPMFNCASHHFSKEIFRLRVMECVHSLMRDCHSSVCLNTVSILDCIINSDFFHCSVSISRNIFPVKSFFSLIKDCHNSFSILSLQTVSKYRVIIRIHHN